MKKVKFKDIWINQKTIGKMFGISSIAVGKILIEMNLKNVDTGCATEYAVKEKFAKFTPLKNGTPYYMWNKKVCELICKKIPKLSLVDYWVNEVKHIFKEAEKLDEEGNDKLAMMMEMYAFEEVPEHIREEVRKIFEEEDNER